MFEPTATPVAGPETVWATDAFLFDAHKDLNEAEDGDAIASPAPKPASTNNAVNSARTSDLVPLTLVAVKTIGGQSRFRPLVVLLDSGGSHTMIKRNDLPRGTTELTQAKYSFATTAGNLKTSSTVELANLVLPEFSRTLHIPKHVAHVFDDATASVHYDLILGRDFLRSAGITIDFSKSEVIWLDHTIPMRPHHYWSESTRIRDALFIEPILAHQLSNESYAVSISDAKYEATDLNDLVSNQTHLSAAQRADLSALLKSVEPLFSGKLGSYPHRTFSLELKPDATPFHANLMLSLESILRHSKRNLTALSPLVF